MFAILVTGKARMPRKSNSLNLNGKVRMITRAEGRRIFDRQARKYFNMSGKEFIRRWEAGEFGDPENPYRSELVALTMQVPFVK